MAEITKTEATKINQVILDSDPQGTLEQLRLVGMSPGSYGSCAPKRDQYSLPAEDRVKGCGEYHHCTLEKIKGISGPINLPYRLYKKGGKVKC